MTQAKATSVQSPTMAGSSSIESWFASSIWSTSMDPSNHRAHNAMMSDLSLSPLGSEVPHAPEAAAYSALADVDPDSLPFPLDLELGVDVVVGKGAAIGRGGTYIVCKGVFQGQEVAVKMFYTNTQEDKQGELLRWVGG